MPRPLSDTVTEPSLFRLTSISVACPARRLVDAVVDDFLGQVIGPGWYRCTCRGRLAHRLQPGEDFNVGSAYRLLAHRSGLARARQRAEFRT